ncbi:PD-(D/E)XK motif protein [Streptomyces triculaminicus]|uniref:PD-(D/E)XK motif protein n=1 Tax=Streptomyces triculaminicus TaxID=2816232 RepID=UPI0037CD8908
MTADSRANWSEVEEYLASGRGVSIPLAGPQSPRVDYVVSDGHDIALHLQLGPRQRLPRSPHPLILVEEIAHEGLRMARLRTTQRTLLRDFHDLLCGVADRVTAGGRTPEQAFGETVRAWRALLERPRELTTERRIGLMGELAVLRNLARAHGWDSAVESWTGPFSEEHDFGADGFDVEVKTTAAEERLHSVHGFDQLTPVPGRPLWVVSIQVTRGGAEGRTLTECVEAVRVDVSDRAPAALERLDMLLGRLGLPRGQDDERWRMRSAPLVLAVDDRFPSLDRSALECLPRDIAARIRDIDYRIDLTGLEPPSDPPSALRNPFALA